MSTLNTRLIYLLRRPVVGWVAHKLLRLQGVQVARTVVWGKGCILMRSALGLVVDGETVFGDRVRIFHQVTLGRASPIGPRTGERIVVGDDVVISAGAKILCRSGEVLSVGTGSVIAANAVLTRSTGDFEIWGGVPARKIGTREVGG